eukprot:50186_1
MSQQTTKPYTYSHITHDSRICTECKPTNMEQLKNNDLTIYQCEHIAKESTESFNLYDGIISERPETPKTSQSFATKILFSALTVILLCILILAMFAADTKKKTKQGINNINIYSTCHYDDEYYSIDKECGIDICNQKGINQILSLTNGWNKHFIQLRKYDGLSILYHIDADNYDTYPDQLFLNTVYDID